MNQPMNEPCDNDQPDTQATPAAPRPGRVLARPEPGETTSEFSERLMAAILDPERPPQQPGTDGG